MTDSLDASKLTDRVASLVEAARHAGADDADAVAVRSRSRGVSVRLGRVESTEASESDDISLRVFVDGLTLLGVNHPEALPAGRIRTLLTTYVDGLADRLRNGPAKVRR